MHLNIALIAHDAKKGTDGSVLYRLLRRPEPTFLCATATTGKMISEATGLKIARFLSGSLGGDQQIAARIGYNEIDLLLFSVIPRPKKTSEGETRRDCSDCVTSTTFLWPPTLPPPKR